MFVLASMFCAAHGLHAGDGAPGAAVAHRDSRFQRHLRNSLAGVHEYTRNLWCAQIYQKHTPVAVADGTFLTFENARVRNANFVQQLISDNPTLAAQELSDCAQTAVVAEGRYQELKPLVDLACPSLLRRGLLNTAHLAFMGAAYKYGPEVGRYLPGARFLGPLSWFALFLGASNAQKALADRYNPVLLGLTPRLINISATTNKQYDPELITAQHMKPLQIIAATMVAPKNKRIGFIVYGIYSTAYRYILPRFFRGQAHWETFDNSRWGRRLKLIL